MKELADLLRFRLRVVADHELRDHDPDAHLKKLREVSEAVVEKHRSLQGGLPPRLEHFLTQCSYEKALDFIEASLA